jgi:aspartate/methionine/tyrosine aminotransferase
MTPPPRQLVSEYMNFAKVGTAARFGLAGSGVMDCSLDDLGVTMDDLALHGPNAYGYAPLVDIIADRFSVSPTHVVQAGGASFANHLAFAAVVAPGDEVLVEDPAYELLTAALGYFQANIRRFCRRPEQGWRLDPDAVAAAITPRTRLIVLTDLHNPTGALAEPAEIAAVARAAHRVGALVLVDEVYLELMFHDGAARTAFRPDGNIVVTSSLTKAYGLSGLRCGWILAQAALAERMRRLNDLFASLPPHVSERLSVAAFNRLPALRARAGAIIAANRDAYDAILGGHPRLEQVNTGQGTTMFPRLIDEDGDAFFDRLVTRFETSVVPGRFFGRPDRIRIGLAGDPVTTRGGLERIAEALAAE